MSTLKSYIINNVGGIIVTLVCETICNGGRLLCQGKSVKEVSAWLDEQQMSELRAYEQSINK